MLFRSTDGGLSWGRVEMDVEPKTTMFAIAFDERQPKRMYCATSGGEVFASEDGGQSWAERHLPEGATQVYAMACARKDAGSQCRLLFTLIRGWRGDGCHCTWENGMTVLRSLLFVPGNRADMLAKAATLTPDAFVPDMEDSVPVEEKTNARTITAACATARAGRVLVIPRVNSLDTGWLEDDLAAVVGPHIYGVSVGKISTPQDVETISDILARLEQKAGVPVGHTKLVLWLETAMAIVHAYAICAASPRIVGAAFGAEDFTHDAGLERSADDSEVAVPRSLVCVAARAANVLALDTPYFYSATLKDCGTMPWPPKKLALRASSPFIPPRSTSSRLPFHRHPRTSSKPGGWSQPLKAERAGRVHLVGRQGRGCASCEAGEAVRNR